MQRAAKLLANNKVPHFDADLDRKYRERLEELASKEDGTPEEKDELRQMTDFWKHVAKVSLKNWQETDDLIQEIQEETKKKEEELEKLREKISWFEKENKQLMQSP